MSLTPFVRLLNDYLERRKAKDPSLTITSLAEELGRDKSTVSRWLSGESEPKQKDKVQLYNQIGIHYNRGGAASEYTRNLIIESLRELMDRAGGRFGYRSELIELVREALFAVEGNIQARVLGRVNMRQNGQVKMLEQAHEDSVAVAVLQYTLDAQPLWQITTGDPYLMMLDHPEPLYPHGSKLVVREPKPSKLNDIPPRTMAIIRIDGEERCVYLLRVSDSFPFLEYLPLHSSPPVLVMSRSAFDIVGVVIEVWGAGMNTNDEQSIE